MAGLLVGVVCRGMMRRGGRGKRAAEPEHAEHERTGEGECEADLVAARRLVYTVKLARDVGRVAQASEPLLFRGRRIPPGLLQLALCFTNVGAQLAGYRFAPPPGGGNRARRSSDQVIHHQLRFTPI